MRIALLKKTCSGVRAGFNDEWKQQGEWAKACVKKQLSDNLPRVVG